MQELDFHGKKILIEDSLAVEYKRVCDEEISIDEMDLSVVNMLYSRFPKDQIDEWKKAGVLRKELIDHALRNVPDEQISEGIIAGIEADIDIGRALLFSG